MKTVILGGGASGLGVAWGLVEAGHKDILIVEKNSSLGGLCGSFLSEGVVVDYGPHRLSPEYPELIEKFRALLGPELLEVPNEHAIVFQNHIYRYPPVLWDFLNFSTLWISVRVLISFFTSRIRSLFQRNVKAIPNTFEEILVSNFGPEFYHRVIQPICLKVWGDPSQLDPDFARLRFSVPSFSQVAKKIFGRQKNVNDKYFYYPRKGFQQLWDALGEHLKKNGVEIWLESQATSIQMEDKGARSVTLSTQGTTKTVPVDWIVSTIPTQHFTRLLKPNPFSATELLSQKFINRGIILILLVVNKPKVLPARVVILPELKYSFNRLSEQNQFSQDTVPAGKAAILADIVCEVGNGMWAHSDEQIAERVSQQVLSLKLFEKRDLERVEVFRVPIAYPVPLQERERAQQKFNETLSTMENILCTGRFASSDYNNSHTALKKGLLATEAILKKCRLSDWYASVEPIRKAAIRD